MWVQGERVHTQNAGFSSPHDSLGLCVKFDVCVDARVCETGRESEKMSARVCVCVCARENVCVWAFLTSLLRHSSRESGVKRKSRSHSVGIHGSGPRGPVRAPLFTDKASPAGPRHTHTEKGSNRRRGGDKVTRGEKVEPGQSFWGGGVHGRGSAWRLPFSQECRCDGLTCTGASARDRTLIWISFVLK